MSVSLRHVRFLLLAGLATLMWPAGLRAQAAPPPFPLDATIAGQRLYVVDAARQLWMRPLPLGPQSTWRRIRFPGGAPIADRPHCAPDNSGNCAVRYLSAGHAEIGLLPAHADAVLATGVPASQLIGYGDAATLYFGRAGEAGRTALFAYDAASRAVRAVGEVSAGEIVDTIVLDGRRALVARRLDGTGRTLDRQPGLVFGRSLSPYAVATPFGMLLAQRWDDAWSATPQAQNLVMLQYRSGSDNRVSARLDSLGSLPFSVPLINYDSLAVDAEGDVFGTQTGVDGTSVFALCQGPTGLQLARLMPIAAGAAARVLATPAGRGALLVQSAPGYSPRISVVQLAEPTANGFQSRRCDGSPVSIEDSGVAAADPPANLTVTVGTYVAGEGARLRYVLLNPNDRPVERLIVNVYGAYGRTENVETLSPAVLEHLIAGRTAIAFVTVRGDGSAGIAAAMASRTPNRQRAVEDVVAVTREIVRRFPTLTAPPTVAGASAGGWLAMAAALQHPDLFAGAIGFSGAYLFTDDPFINERSHFFGPLDDFARNGILDHAVCSGERFRFIHAEDDLVTTIAQARRFAAMLGAHGCPNEFLAMSSGGHAIATATGSQARQQLIEAYFTALAPSTPPPARAQATHE